MMMKAVLFIIFLTPCFALANNITLKSKEIGSPLYRTISEIWLQVSNNDTRTVKVEFIGTKGKITEEVFLRRFQPQDFDVCRAYPCGLFLMDLPMTLEPVTCEIKVHLDGVNVKTNVLTQKWGSCKPSTQKPGTRFLPDLVIAEDQVGLTSVEIFNEGAGFVSKKITSLAYLEDKKGNVIWASSVHETKSLSSDEAFVLSFPSLASWQEHLGCQARIVVDADYGIHEKKKKNNELIFPFGNCESIPTMENGDRFDFAPIIEEEAGRLKFSVINLGRLPMLQDYERLEYDLTYFNENGQPVFSRSFTVRAPFYGFGDRKLLYEDIFPVGTCRVIVRLNANLLLKESNYQNNQTQFSRCY